MIAFLSASRVGRLIVGAAAAAATQNDVLIGDVAGLRRYDGSRRHSVHV
jgi:hypothetical protein